MARRTSDIDADIKRVLAAFPAGVSGQEVMGALARPVSRRALQYRLQALVAGGHLVKQGDRRWARYELPPTLPESVAGITGPQAAAGFAIPLSPAGVAVRNHARQPLGMRKPVGYDRGFLDAYRPNVTFYLSAEDRTRLSELGRPSIAAQPAGTYAKQILNRLLIDLSWNSSRLEGNTYSLLDTKRLLRFGHEAEGRAHLEAQMILNHKDAISFLVGAADEIGFNRYTVLNLHALLANNLLPDPAAPGRLRRIAVGIERSVFHPLEVPQLIEECFDQALATAEAIADPFEQAFFAMVQLPLLQPFDDVNKRVSRLAANIPLIRRNLAPLSFVDVPRETYTEAVLGVYELSDVALLRDVFLWAYSRSAMRYAAVRQSLGEPDPFRFRYRAELREVVAYLIRARVARRDVVARIAAWIGPSIEPGDRARFDELVETELASLHEGNFARYQVRPSEYAAWQSAWDAP